MGQDYVRQGNGRDANAARFIAAQGWRRGAEPHELVLLCWCGDDAPNVVCRWPFETVKEELGYTISELVEQYADDERQHCKARLEFRGPPGANGAPAEVLSSKQMRGIYKGANSIGMGNGVAYDGSMGAILQQNQKHLEVSMQQYFKLGEMLETKNLQHVEVMERILSRIEHSANEAVTRERARADALEQEVAQLRDMVDRAVDTAEANAKAAEEAADQDRVGQVIEMVQKQLAGGAK